MKPLVLVLSLLLAAAVGLGACGKKGPPQAPGENQYPRKYPAET